MPAYTNQQIADYLRFGFWESLNDTPGLSFGKTSLTVNLSGISAEAQALARAALEFYEDATGLSFTETGGAADITFREPSAAVAQTSFGSLTQNGGGSYTIGSATVEIGSDWLQINGTTPGGYGYQTFLHEIGHALGLGHAGPYNGSATWGTDNLYDNDSWQTTVMSYFSQAQNPYVGASFAFVMTPQVADLIALQAMYGTGNGRAGDTTYGYNATPGVGVYNAAKYAGNVSYTVWDAGGTDTLDYSRSATNDRIDLRAAVENGTALHASSVWGEVGNVMIAPGVVIENAIGGAGHNRIVGNGAANRLEGRAGNDRLVGASGSDSLYGGSGDDRLAGGGGHDRLVGGHGRDELIGGSGGDGLFGGQGVDRALYVGASGAVRADLARAGTNAGDAAGDTYQSVEDLAGSKHGDALRGDGGANRLWGGKGGDFLGGRNGSDLLAGEGGHDHLKGGAGRDRLKGGSGNDDLDGGGGADTLIGGKGFDRALYTSADRGVKADLGRPGVNSREAAGDSYDTIEGLVGSAHDDVLRGDGRSNRLWGAEGDDFLGGCRGDDVIAGGTGHDRLKGGAGHDWLNGGSGADTLVGASGKDALVGGTGGDRLIGGGGADRFHFRRGFESDEVRDFDLGADALVLDDALWNGFLRPAEVIDSFASLEGGDAVFDFGGGDTIALLGVGTLDLEDDILIV